jgi:hypothetical protein
VHGLDGLQILIDHRRDGAPALRRVALQPSDESKVVVSVHEHLHVHQLAQRRIGENQDAFDNHAGARHDGVVMGLPRVAREIVRGRLHGAPVPQRAHVLHHQLGLERPRVVVVQSRALVE